VSSKYEKVFEGNFLQSQSMLSNITSQNFNSMMGRKQSSSTLSTQNYVEGFDICNTWLKLITIPMIL